MRQDPRPPAHPQGPDEDRGIKGILHSNSSGSQEGGGVINPAGRGFLEAVPPEPWNAERRLKGRDGGTLPNSPWFQGATRPESSTAPAICPQDSSSTVSTGTRGARTSNRVRIRERVHRAS